MKIRNEYTITTATTALIPSYRPDCRTIALEEGKKILVDRTAMEIIEAACLQYFSSYEGRRIAVRELTGGEKKLPIIIDPAGKIFAFPTHSPEHLDCHWLFFYHVKNAIPADSNHLSSIVTLSDNSQLLLPVSPYVIKKQRHLTSFCMAYCISHS